MSSSAARNWDRAHIIAGTSTDDGRVPSRLYTDENPATTIKGTGFKNRAIAERTIGLTSQPGVRYKQYWTIRAMRERAAHHPHQTDGMRDAIAVFDEWLINFTDPTAEERKAQREEWEEFNRLCNSVANQHAYGKEPTPEELNRARQDLAEGQKLLVDLLSTCLRPSSRKSDWNKNGLQFPITQFTALFGGPGIHGYGKHTVTNRSEEMGNNGATCCYASSQIDIGGLEGIEELIGKSNTTKLGLFAADIRVCVIYNRNEQTATVNVERGQSSATLTNLWRKGGSVDRSNAKKTQQNDDSVRAEQNDNDRISWACAVCTFLHEGMAKESFLACELCGSERRNDIEKGSANNGRVKQIPSAPAAAGSLSMRAGTGLEIGASPLGAMLI